MIIDKIENISKYFCSPPHPNPQLCTQSHTAHSSPVRTSVPLGEGVRPMSDKVINFLQNLTPETPTGRYEISDGIYANVDEYEPKDYENCKFEAHKKYIDIQMVLKGEENLEYRCINGLKISEEYDENRDIMFFENPEEKSDYVHLTPYKFAFIYPHEAHKPQIKTVSSHAKKVVVKIKMAG